MSVLQLEIGAKARSKEGQIADELSAYVEPRIMNLLTNVRVEDGKIILMFRYLSLEDTAEVMKAIVRQTFHNDVRTLHMKIGGVNSTFSLDLAEW